MLKIKDGIGLKELEKFGYSKSADGSKYYKYAGNHREIVVWVYDRHIDDYVIDNTTYCGYKYEGEYRHRVYCLTKDLQQAGLIENVKDY